MSDCETCVVRNRAICSALEPAELAALGKLGRKQSISRGQTLVWEGDESLVVANVIKGVLKLAVSATDGREQIVGVIFPSDFIGRPFGKESPYGVTALTDAEVCVFTRAAFDGFAREHSDLQHKLLQRTLDELDRARQWMMLLGRKTASEKIATLLIEISNRLGDSGCSAIAPFLERFEMPMDRQQMGDVLGLTIETVSRQLTKLKEADIIALPDRRTIVIKDRKRLHNLAFAV
jgi:CRP/FNR family transcriptional regulator, anaerobic regulatory protein